jgi:hypothetical protein
MTEELENEIQTIITERLVVFHKAMVERGQIAPPEPRGPLVSEPILAEGASAT